MPVKTVVSIWPLFAGLSLIGLAVGVQGSLLGVRATLEGFDDFLIGLLMSCYFAGFLAGSLLTPKMIQRVGHIRIFAALSAVASVTILIHSIYVEPWAWALMRLFTGFAFSTIYVVSESWLNQASTNANRGQILSIYTAILLAGICAGQFMLNLANPLDFTLFILISVMVSVAAVPILLSVVITPTIEDSDRVTIRHLWYRTPMGVTGIVLSQWVSSILFGMGAVYATKLGFTVYQVANFMGAMMAGGMILQWPLGKLSDMIDRRWVMGFACLCAVGFALLISRESEASLKLYGLIFAFGGCSLSLYSIVVALTNDHLRPSEIVPASGTIVLISGLTSITGPITAVFWLQIFGLQSFFVLLASCLLLLAGISIWRVLTIEALPSEYKGQVILQAATAPVGTVLHAEDDIPPDTSP
ncbi:MFS transporter [Porticoccaceae bacterium]|jgi:MFS family permease|nr:MFS transporter [Porticoccaceae bacterium]MDC1476751.1 MFS transporter [Porticoccaceae bacterium]CAI8300307.1 MAG: putative MFS-type transporter YcaD [SAR92 bacterium MED-G29]